MPPESSLLMNPFEVWIYISVIIAQTIIIAFFGKKAIDKIDKVTEAIIKLELSSDYNQSEHKEIKDKQTKHSEKLEDHEIRIKLLEEEDE